MIYRVRVSPSAVADRRRLIAFLAERSPAAARRAGAAFRAALSSLTRFPFRHPGDDGDEDRELLISFGASGYIVQYRVVGREVVVARIFHAREDR